MPDSLTAASAALPRPDSIAAQVDRIDARIRQSFREMLPQRCNFLLSYRWGLVTRSINRGELDPAYLDEPLTAEEKAQLNVWLKEDEDADA